MKTENTVRSDFQTTLDAVLQDTSDATEDTEKVIQEPISNESLDANQPQVTLAEQSPYLKGQVVKEYQKSAKLSTADEEVPSFQAYA